MRLVCPNCEAKYEVPEDAIPETGRDVQCANCGHAWYQMRQRPAASAPVAAPMAAATIESPQTPVPEAPVETPVEMTPEPVVEDAVAEAPEAAAAEEPEPVESAAAELAAPEAEAAAPEASVEAVLTEAEAMETPPAEAPVTETADVETHFAETAYPETPLAETTDVETNDVEVPAADPLVDEVMGSIEPEAEEPVAAEAYTEAEAPSEEVVGEVEAMTEPVLAAASAPAAYAVDDSVLAILREEAEREAQARRAEGARSLETQTDLGIEAAMPAAIKKAVEVISADAPAPAAEEHAGDAKLSARRSLLPDVEEINSTLRPSDHPSEEEATEADAPVAARRSSFRSGFLLVMTIAILGAALYLSADTLAEVVPALAGPLKSFVGFVDSLRLQLDGLMQSATVAINGDGA